MTDDFRTLCAELAAELRLYKIAHPMHEESLLDRARAALAATPPRPVPVAERLPGPEDCDAEGRCWWCDSIQWRWDFLIADNRKPSAYDHWLPAHAIPLPQENTDA